MFLHIDPSCELAIYDQVVRQVKFAVADGAVRSGELVPSVRELARQQLMRFEAQGGGNFITDYAYLFPTLVMCDMLGMSDDEAAQKAIAEIATNRRVRREWSH